MTDMYRERLRMLTAHLSARVEWLADVVNDRVGSPGVFALALLAIGLWALSGPSLRFSDTWQLIINTSTTIITFLLCILNAISLRNAKRHDDMQAEHNVAQAERLEHMEIEHGEMLRALHAMQVEQTAILRELHGQQPVRKEGAA